MNKENLIEGILSLETHDELDDIIGAVKSARKAIDAKEVALKRHLFRVGQTVNIVEKNKTTQGIISKMKIKRAIVTAKNVQGEDVLWDCPLTMLEVV